MPETTTAADVFLNRASVTVGKRRSIVKSWLPPTKDADENSKSVTNGDELEAIEQLDILPDHVGIGAAFKYGNGEDAEKRKQMQARDKLRKHILGNKNACETSIATSRVKKRPKDYSSYTRNPETTKRGYSSDDEDSGKASMFVIKKSNVARKDLKDMSSDMNVLMQGEADRGTDQASEYHSKIRGVPASLRKHDSLKRGYSFLNDVLAERQLKQKKRRMSSKGE